MTDIGVLQPDDIDFSPSDWANYGRNLGATHMFIVHDGGEGPDALGPAYVIPGQESYDRIEQLCWIAGHIMEVIEL